MKNTNLFADYQIEEFGGILAKMEVQKPHKTDEEIIAEIEEAFKNF